MTLQITHTTMESDRTRHNAWFDPDVDRWRVTWLAGVELSHTEAVTAMTIAETVEGQLAPIDDRHRMWPHIAGWARELGLTGPDAMSLVRADPGSLLSRTESDRNHGDGARVPGPAPGAAGTPVPADATMSAEAAYEALTTRIGSDLAAKIRARRAGTTGRRGRALPVKGDQP